MTEEGPRFRIKAEPGRHWVWNDDRTRLVERHGVPDLSQPVYWGDPDAELREVEVPPGGWDWSGWTSLGYTTEGYSLSESVDHRDMLRAIRDGQSATVTFALTAMSVANFRLMTGGLRHPRLAALRRAYRAKRGHRW